MAVATRPIIAADRSRSNRSRMMARPMTTPVAAPIACSTRMRMNVVASGVAIAARLATPVKARPPSTTGRRPKRSDSGPISNWAAASPARNSETASWTVSGSESNAAVRLGSAGTTILSDVGPIAVIAISSASRRQGVGCVSERKICSGRRSGPRVCSNQASADSGAVAASSQARVRASTSGVSASRTRA